MTTLNENLHALFVNPIIYIYSYHQYVVQNIVIKIGRLIVFQNQPFCPQGLQMYITPGRYSKSTFIEHDHI